MEKMKVHKITLIKSSVLRQVGRTLGKLTILTLLENL